MEELAEDVQTPGSAKKRHHRRARKRKGPKEEIENSKDSSSLSKGFKSGDKSPEPSKRCSKLRRRCRKKLSLPMGVRSVGGGGSDGSSGKSKGQLVLRPTNGPQLHAPKNSTQYIIEDHGEDNTREDAEHSEDAQKDLLSPDDDTFWDEFSERDFQTVYESAHREEVAEWDREKLVTEISTLEKRQKELISHLSRLDPDVYLRRLQARATSILEKNRLLKMQIKLSSSAANSDGEGSSGSTAPA